MLDLQALLPTWSLPGCHGPCPRPSSHPSSWSNSLHSERVPRMLTLETFGWWGGLSLPWPWSLPASCKLPLLDRGPAAPPV